MLALLVTAGAAGGHVRRAGSQRLLAMGGAGFRDLALTHAASAAGDTLVTIALAGTLFFSVPTGEARANVLLYLLLTVAPFAVIGPGLGLLLHRRPYATRIALIASSVLRAAAALALVGRMQSLWLFPAAFALLVLSRAHGISRNALVPIALDEPRELVTANARLAWLGVLAGAVVAPIGLLGVRLAGAAGPLALAVVLFVVAALLGRRVPDPQAGDEVAVGRRSSRRLSLIGPLHLPQGVRLAQLATAVVRLLNGFLVLVLAFAFRTEAGAGLLDFGALLAGAGAGYVLGSLVSPFLEARLREEPMVVAALAIEAGAAFVAGQWFGLPAAVALAAAAGLSWGTAKLAFDGLLQATVDEDRRGVAFTRSETVFQLAWVAGAVVPVALPLAPSLGLVLAGLTALGAQVIYVGHLLLPRR